MNAVTHTDTGSAAVHRLPSRAPIPEAPQLRLRRLGVVVKVLAVVGALLMAALPVLLLFTDVMASALAAESLLGGSLPPLATPARWRAAAVSLLPVGATCFALWQLWWLFDEYGQGRVFSPAALARLRRFAQAWLALALLQPLVRALMSVAVSWDNPPGQRTLIVSLGWPDYMGWLMAAVLLAIAKVMVEAQRLADDNAGFV